MSAITVLLAEDHLIVREGLRALLKLEKDIEVVGEASNGRQAVELSASLHPEVVVMDIAMPQLNGMEATRQILRTAPDIKVLILSAHSDDVYVQQVMALVAAGYLIKQTAADSLSKAIREVHQEKPAFSPLISKRFYYHQKKARDRGELPMDKNAVLLSSREMEVLQHIAEGKTNKETAEHLHICVKTVEKHRQSLMEKLNIHNIAGLTHFAISRGIIESSEQVSSE